jgi:hypothetical protein
MTEREQCQALPMCEHCGDSIMAHNPGICGTCHATHETGTDTARLDFMVRRSAVVQWYGETCQLHGDQGVISGEGEFYDSAREAIDAAMALEAK